MLCAADARALIAHGRTWTTTSIDERGGGGGGGRGSGRPSARRALAAAAAAAVSPAIEPGPKPNTPSAMAAASVNTASAEASFANGEDTRRTTVAKLEG
eukprot:scaffold231829_cov32-Tisochrysis_lutea.AAC.3